jgi:nanoRNase/pAp phosphatase (c-di-AMP/oligoRNAs hydrolase)
MTSNNTKRSDCFLEILSPFDNIVIVTHDVPDPDAIAAGWALSWLLEKKLGKRPKLVGRGPVIRAENKFMIKLFHPPLLLIDRFVFQDHAVVLVDCVPTASNHLLNKTGIQVDAVIDHHQRDNHQCRARYQDIRSHVAATAGIAAGYLIEQNMEPFTELATALLYAIRTETQGERGLLSDIDRQVISWLGERADHAQIAAIEKAPLPRDYYVDLLFAIENTQLYENVGICFLPHAAGGELVGEIADFLIRCNDLSAVLCGAVVGDALVLSARTARGGANAAELLQHCLKSPGDSGGHEHRAGGKIPLRDNEAAVIRDLQSLLKQRWLQACHVNPRQEPDDWLDDDAFGADCKKHKKVLQ